MLRINILINIFVTGGFHSGNYEDIVFWHVTPYGLSYNLQER